MSAWAIIATAVAVITIFIFFAYRATGSKNLPPVGVSERSSNEPASDL